MKHFQLISHGIDINPLLKEIEDHPELWDYMPYRKQGNGTPHAHMSDIWIRYRRREEFKEAADYKAPHIPVWYPAYYELPSLRKIIFDLMRDVQGESICGVLITRIPAGEGIDPHVDEGWHVNYTDKFYLTLKNSKGSEFVCSHDGVEESLCPNPGEIWRFDNRKPHWVKNNSQEDRITLIICIRTEMFKDVADYEATK